MGLPVGTLRFAHPTCYALRRVTARAMSKRALLQKYIYWLRTVFDLSGSKRLTLFAD
jgi:hypothetical protein